MTREREILDEICGQLEKAKDELAGFRVFLFGSRAAGTAKERSDFDIGVYGAGPLALNTFFKISDLLDQVRTLYRIDWVDLHETSEQFRTEALKNARVLYG
ncbi:MAG: nucleotidyltransferase domain-containing protein [Kiritimatiellales bacterium]|nr:nucleotidyltransferase domain-containing protein [Kiritimatiellales bacterium]MCF7863209.1 nucleotidyltransferase domain-containing protein [Kiritimatiellales bacterium]